MYPPLSEYIYGRVQEIQIYKGGLVLAGIILSAFIVFNSLYFLVKGAYRTRIAVWSGAFYGVFNGLSIIWFYFLVSPILEMPVLLLRDWMIYSTFLLVFFGFATGFTTSWLTEKAYLGAPERKTDESRS